MVLVKRQTPLSALLPRLRFVTDVLCKSAYLREDQIAKRKPPSSKRSQSGLSAVMMVCSHFTNKMKGIGIASLRSRGSPGPRQKLEMRNVLSTVCRSSIKAVFASHFKPRKRACGWRRMAWTSLLEASLAMCRICTNRGIGSYPAKMTQNVSSK